MALRGGRYVSPGGSFFELPGLVCGKYTARLWGCACVACGGEEGRGEARAFWGLGGETAEHTAND